MALAGRRGNHCATSTLDEKDVFDLEYIHHLTYAL